MFRHAVCKSAWMAEAVDLGTLMEPTAYRLGGSVPVTLPLSLLVHGKELRVSRWIANDIVEAVSSDRIDNDSHPRPIAKYSSLNRMRNIRTHARICGPNMLSWTGSTACVPPLF